MIEITANIPYGTPPDETNSDINITPNLNSLINLEIPLNI